MKTRKKILSIIMAFMIAGSLGACSSNDETESDVSSTEETASVTETSSVAANTAASSAASSKVVSNLIDDQNPLMNFIGPYSCDGVQINIRALGTDEAEVSVNWTKEDGSFSFWNMTGKWNAGSKAIDYFDCEKTEITISDDGASSSEKIAYQNGAGHIIFGDDNKITWDDTQEHIADGMTFEFVQPTAR